MKKLLYILLFVPLALFGQGNYSLSFDGVDDYVDLGIPNGMNPTGSHTFLLFSKKGFTESCSGSTLISQHLELGSQPNNNMLHYGFRGCETYCPDGNCMGMDFYANNVFTNTYYGDGWDFWAFVYNSSTLERKIYLNGVLLAEDIASASYQGNFDLILGATDYIVDPGMVAYFSGFIDDVSLWAYPLSLDEIQSYMSSCINGNEVGLIGFWNFNEGAGDTIYDISPNGNHGIIYGGATLSEDVPEQNCTYVEEFSNLNQIDGFSYGGFYDGSYYFVSQELASWEEANAICNSSGGYLTSITSEEENNFISSLLNLELEDGWIGLTDSLIEGDWVWSNGELYEYNNWANNEPGGTDGSSDENHGLIHISGTWNDGYELTYHQYIMEIDAIYGCLDPDYYNYNPQANTSDDLCLMNQEFIIDSLQQALAVFETVEEVQDYSMNFDGSNYLDLGAWSNYDLNYASQSFTLLLDVNPSFYGSFGTEDYIIGTPMFGGNNDRGFSLRTSPENEFYVAVGGNSNIVYCYSDPFSEDEWYDIAIVFDQSNDIVSFYINGLLENTVSLSEIGTINNAYNLYLGAFINYQMTHYFGGYIDNVSIWDFALSQDEMQSYISCPPTGQEGGLVGYWNFNEGSGDTVYDLSGNGNHGVNIGAEFSEDVPESQIGCTDENALNFDADALCDNGSCVFADDVVSNLEESFNQTVSGLNNIIDEATSSLSSLQQALDTWNTTIDLDAGWNMFGYGCPTSIDVADGLSNHTESIIITKDNSGNVYMPEFGFNGIGAFIPGFGYQIKLTEAIEGFSLCDWYVNDIPEDNIVSLQDSIINMHNANCIEDGYCSFDNNNQICITPEDGYDCFGYELISHQVGDIVQGGIVFYVDETGQHGLVAAMEDLAENMSWNNAILASESFTAQGYSDWYIPSFEELTLMYMTIGNGGLQGNIGAFSDYGYWSSTLNCNQIPLAITFYNGDMYDFDSTSPYKTRLIRSF